MISALEDYLVNNVVVEHEGVKYSYMGNESQGIESLCVHYNKR